jgi:hypothetical protein
MTRVRAVHVSDGVYEVKMPIKAAGAYYVYVAVPSRKIKYDDLRYLTLMATIPPVAAASLPETPEVAK